MKQLAGKGLLANRLWEIEGGDPAALARQARRMGLSWLLLGLASGRSEQAPEAARARLAAVIQELQASGLSIWGLGRLGLDASAAIDKALELVLDYQLDGWAIETTSLPDLALDPLLASLASQQAELGRGILVPASRAARYAPALVDHGGLCLARIDSPGSLGIAVAELGSARGLRPILSPRPGLGGSGGTGALSPSAIQDFLASAQACGAAGLALESWDELASSTQGAGAASARIYAGWPWEPEPSPA